MDAERITLTKYFVRGISTLLASDSTFSGLPLLAKDQRLPRWKQSDVEEFIAGSPLMQALRHPDVFFTVLQWGMARDFAEHAANCFQNAPTADEVRMALLDSFRLFSSPTALISKLEREASDLMQASDTKLKERAEIQVQLMPQDMVELDIGTQYVYSKINHGYWEFLINSYALPGAAGENKCRFRDLSTSSHVELWPKSGFHAALLSLIRDKINLLSGKAQYVDLASNNFRLAISFCAGERYSASVLRDALSPVARGALVGCLAFFSVCAEKQAVRFGDGAEPRGLLYAGKLEEFAARFIRGAEACLLVVPPHLRSVVVGGFGGPTYKLVIPGQVVHETWRVVLPIFLGLIEEMLENHDNIVVLTQSAVMAPIMGLGLADCVLRSRPNKTVRYFDLGRVLDIARPDILAKWGSTASVLDDPGFERCRRVLMAEGNDNSFEIVKSFESDRW